MLGYPNVIPHRLYRYRFSVLSGGFLQMRYNGDQTATDTVTEENTKKRDFKGLYASCTTYKITNSACVGCC